MKHLPINQQDILRLLERAPVFHGLLSDELSAVGSVIIAKSFDEGEKLADFGDAVEEFWILIDGSLDTYFNDEHGRMSLLASVGPNEHLGEVSLIEKSSRPVRITAQTDGKLLAITKENFIAFIETYPVLMRNLFRHLSIRFKTALGARTRGIPSKRLGIIAPSGLSRILVARMIGRLAAHGERLHILADDAMGIRNQVAWPENVTVTELVRSSEIPEALPSNIDRQILVLSRQSPHNVDSYHFHNCGEVLWLLEPKDAGVVAPCVQRLTQGDHSLTNKLRLVWLLSKEQPVAPWLPDAEFKKNAIKVHVLEDVLQPSRLEVQGLDRLVRAMRGYKLGIALAGGGAKGMAHLGVLRALDDAGITFDVMSGTSAGAMAGIIYASGVEPLEAAEHFQKDLTPSRAFRCLPGWPNLYLLTQFRRRAWEAMLRPYLNDARLEQLPIDFLSLTVDLVKSSSVVRKTGDAVHAILESINLPVISKPILRDGMVLVDGGMLDNLPADVLANRGCDFIVGVDVSRRMNYEFAGNRPDTPTHLMKNVGALETLMRIFESQAHDIRSVRSRSIDFWITPDTSAYGLADFYRSQEIATVGEQTTRKLLPELQQRLSDLEKRLFNPALT